MTAHDPPLDAPIPFVDLGGLHAEIASGLRDAIGAVVEGSAFVGGPHVEQFEELWAHRCGRDHAVGVGSGTDAIELALRALGIGRGDEVLVPTNTFVATAEAVRHAGAIPVFTDVHADTLLVDLDDAASMVTERTAAILPVHLYGQPVDMDAVTAFARRHDLVVVEDAAQAHGARWRGRPVGSFGDVGCFSFYPGKNLGALGDAGAVVTDDPGVAERIRSLADHGRSRASKHVHEHLGMNSRLDGIQAAVLVEKLHHLDGWTDRRRVVAKRYDELLAETSLEPTVVDPRAQSVFHLYVVRTDERDDLAAALHGRGVGTGVHYPVPCHLQPAMSRGARRRMPVAERAAERVLSLPMSPTMRPRDAEHVIDRVLDAGWCARPETPSRPARRSA